VVSCCLDWSISRISSSSAGSTPSVGVKKSNGRAFCAYFSAALSNRIARRIDRPHTFSTAGFGESNRMMSRADTLTPSTHTNDSPRGSSPDGNGAGVRPVGGSSDTDDGSSRRTVIG
jgi:hypothetical protein